MDVCGLPKTRPIVCNDSPAFQRHHTSVRCAAESSTRFPWVIDTTSGVMIYIRWCCIDLLNPPGLPDIESLCGLTLSASDLPRQSHRQLPGGGWQKRLEVQ